LRAIRSHPVEVERFVLRLALHQERAKAPDDVGGALVRFDDVAESSLQFGPVQRFPVKEALHGLGIAENRRQRLIQLVGDRPGQLAEDADARQVGEFLALLVRIGFGLFAPRDVAVRHDGPALGTPEGNDRHLEPLRAGGAPVAVFHAEFRLRSAQDRGDSAGGPGGVAIPAGQPACAEIVRTDRSPRECSAGIVLTEAPPGLVGGDDDAAAIDDGDVLA
jgi:hypothetical protein